MNFRGTGVSAMDPSQQVFTGRPYGGVGILWHKQIDNLLSSVCQDQGYLTLLLDPTQVESKNTIVKSNDLSQVLMLNLWIFSLEKK